MSQNLTIKPLIAILLVGLLGCVNPKNTLQNNRTLKVMTYNVHHCNPPGEKSKIDVDAIAHVIKSQNADLVAVQEVDVNTARSGKINQASLLAEKSGFNYYYFGKAMNFDGGEYGLLILSKHPLSQTSTLFLPKAKKDEQRVLVLATATLPSGKKIRFGNTHLEAYNKSSRELQIREINRVAEVTTLPFIVAGDFNDKENSGVIKTLDASFMRTCNNCPKTFDEDGESDAIDYIAFKKGDKFSILSHQVLNKSKESDHFPVIAELAF